MRREKQDVNLEEWLKKQNMNFGTSLEKVKRRAEEIWESPDHEHYTKHGIKHSERVIEKIGKLIDNYLGSSFDAYSIFLLVASAYLHDIGMQARKFLNVYESWGLESIREKHHEISSKWIQKEYPSLGIEEDLGVKEEDARWIARIAKGHSSEVELLNNQEYPESFKIDKRQVTIHPRVLAALLRFADALHIAWDRIDIEKLRKNETIPPASRIQWWLHYYVSSAYPDIKTSSIRIDFRVPKQDYEFWRQFIPKVITKRIEKDYESVKFVLAKFGIPIVGIKEENIVQFEEQEKEKIPSEVFEDMLFYSFLDYDLDYWAKIHLDLIERAQGQRKTLDNFPQDFSPLVIVPGDVREEDPVHPQDLLADTASTSDLAWISKLNLPEDTILLPDKFASKPELKEFLKDRNLLIIGSPGVNWLSRHVWRKGPFYFVVGKETIKEAKERESKIKGLNPDGLKKYKPENRLIEKLKGKALYDLFKGEILQAGDQYNKYGVISLCKHPFSEKNYAILAGGPRLLGTMAAEKLLADKEGLKKRPFGGVVKAIEAAGEPKGIDLVEASVEWVTDEYDFDKLKKTLEEHWKGVRK